MADGMTVSMRAAIRTKLLEKIQNVYYGRTRGSVTGLSAIFTLDSSTYEENIEQYQLVVNVLNDLSQNTESLDNKADEIWELMDHWFYSSVDTYFEVYQQTRSRIVDDSDENSIHQRLVFTVRRYK